MQNCREASLVLTVENLQDGFLPYDGGGVAF